MPFDVGASVLDFTEDDDSESYKRLEDAGARILQHGSFEFEVSLTDRNLDDTHRVELFRDHGREMGRCDCPGFRYHEGPCAHLWGLYRAESHGVIEIRSLNEVLHDGGRCPVCGSEVTDEYR